MAAPPPITIQNNVYCLDIIHVKPKYMLPMMQYFKDGTTLFEKHGAKYHGMWIPEAGAAHSIVTLMEWPGMDVRSKALESLWSDPQFLEYRKVASRFIQSIDNHVCKSNPYMQVKQINPKGKYMIQTYKAKSMPIFAAWKLHDMNEMMEKKFGAEAAHCVGLFHPIAALSTEMILIREVPDNALDRTFNNWGKALFDHHNWLHLADAHDHYERTRNVLVQPIPWDKVPAKFSLEQIFGRPC